MTNLSNIMLKELSSEFKSSWKEFVYSFINKHGQEKYDTMLRDTKDVIVRHWWGQWNNPQRGDAIIEFNDKYPDLIEYMRDTLEMYHEREDIKLYRGMKLKNDFFFNNGPDEVRKFINGSSPTLSRSYKGMNTFSWTDDYTIAEAYADRFREVNSILLVAHIPVRQILWAGSLMLRIADPIISREYIVRHDKDVHVSNVISNIEQIEQEGQDKNKYIIYVRQQHDDKSFQIVVDMRGRNIKVIK